MAAYDPRPVVVRPMEVEPWEVAAEDQAVNLDPPVWLPLHEVAAGTWIDVPVPELAAGASDLQLLAVRFVDPGHPEQKLGPRYRVWLRNNGPAVNEGEFNVMILASDDSGPSKASPQAVGRVSSVEPGAIQAFDLRLPETATAMSRDENGRAVPFSQLHVVVDSHVELRADAIPANNGAIVPRQDIVPVDPSLFSADQTEVAVGSSVTLAGEGLGPEPGQVIVSVGDLQLNARIEGWYDLGIRVTLPELQLAGEQEVQLIVIRGDSAVSNPIPLKLLPQGGTELPKAELEPERLEF